MIDAYIYIFSTQIVIIVIVTTYSNIMYRRIWWTSSHLHTVAVDLEQLIASVWIL